CGVRPQERVAGELAVRRGPPHGAGRRATRPAAAEVRAACRRAVPAPPPDASAGELQRALDEEGRRPAGGERPPFLPCCLEGRSRGGAARELGWPEGTVSSRLAEARRLLQERLARRGFLLSAALAAGLASEAVPPALAQATSRSALALTA